MDDIKYKALQSLLRRLNKSEQDYSDIPEDVLQAYSDYETNQNYGKSIMNNDAWRIEKAKQIKNAEMTGRLKQYENDLLPRKVIDNYKAEDELQGGDVDRLHQFLRLQDVLKK